MQFVQINDATSAADKGRLNQALREVHDELGALRTRPVTDLSKLEKRLKELEARVLRLEHP